MSVYYRDLEESKRLGDVLNEIDNILYSTLDYDSTMNKMLQLATDGLGAETAVIFSKEGERWRVRYEYKLPVSLLGQTFSNTEVMHTTVTATTKRSLVVQDTLNSPEIDQKFVRILGVRSLLDFPLVLKGEVIGDLTFHYHSSAVPFNERQVEFVRKLQISISLALENGRLLDISKQSESKLKEAEKLGKFGYFNYDNRSGRTTWSEGVFHLLGRDSVLGEPTVEEFFESYSVDPGLEKMRELVEIQGINEFDAKIQRGGLLGFLHFSIRSVTDAKGDIVASFGTIQDITERRQVEDALRGSEERFRATFNQAAVGIGHLTPDGQWLLINQKLCDVVGYTEVELKALTFKDITHPEDREMSLRHFQLLRDGKLANYAQEKRLIRKDGSTIWINVTASMVPGADGSPIFVVFVVEDITKRKRTEEEIEKLHIAQAARAEELEAANRELAAFNYTVAHDLRGPLNTIGLYLQTIQKLYGDKLDEACGDYLTKGYENVQRMSQLIEVLLEFSKLSNTEPCRGKVDISAVAMGIVDELKRISPERRYVFRTTDGIMVNGDPKLLGVALHNLIRNAWKYTGKKEEAVIEFGATEIAGKPAYFVRDNGEGFDMADANKLFIPFQRLPGSEEFRGSGVGLATVERIIRRHGGRIWAEGEPGKGACFYFTLSPT